MSAMQSNPLNNDITQSSEWPLVSSTIARAAGIDDLEVQPEMDLLTDLDMDSLAIFEVAVDLEATYDFTIADEEIERLRTAGDVVRYIESRRQS